MLKLDVNVWLHSHCLELGTVKCLRRPQVCATQSLSVTPRRYWGVCIQLGLLFGISQWLNISSNGGLSQPISIIVILFIHNGYISGNFEAAGSDEVAATPSQESYTVVDKHQRQRSV